MQLVNYRNIEEQQGNLLLFYSPPGAGKTSTILQTCNDPVDYLTAEMRKISTTVKAINRPDLRMRVGIYEGFEDCIETVYDVKRFEGARTVFVDSFTHLMAAHLAFEILDENYNSKTDAEKDEIIKELTTRVKFTKEGYGSLSDNMLRLMNGLQKLTMSGIDVIVTARAAERPKYNKEIAYGPALSGQKFGYMMPGYFDFIGMLEAQEHGDDDPPPPYNADIKTLWSYHAPLASYNKTEAYLAKWTGPYPPSGVIKRKLSVRRLLEEGNGRFE